MMAKQKVALDCLSYHASAAIDDTEELAKAAIPTANTYSLHRYEYSFCVCSAAGKKRESITYTKCEKASCPKGLVHSYFDMEKLLLLLFEKCPLRIVLQQVLLPYI